MSYATRLRDAREALNLTQEETADRIGVSRQTIRDWESGKSVPTRKHHDAISDVLGVQILHAASEPAAYSLDQNKYAFVPKYTAKVGAGSPAENGHEEVDGKHAYRRDWLEKMKLIPAALVVVEVEGDSMSPTIFDGDDVLVNTLQKTVISGRVFAFRTDDGAKVKRLIRQADGRILVSSDNPNKAFYPDEYLTPDVPVDIIGMVVHRSGKV
ncbi:MAG: helix-turn-helix transcriptional regulator [Betaproteobacteria bacterium]|nr:helix-turn-helix transcriptional regulator [Betaproteobacteria bacterium]